jgi:F0F1-type ATP synthase assembly protein I
MLTAMTDREPSRGQLARQGAAAYQGALEAVLAIAIAAGIGAWADHRWSTSPRWLIVGTLVGFAAFVLRLFRMRRLFDPPPGSTKD